MKDVRIELRFRNNLILEHMERKGIKSVAELCRLSGAQQIPLGRIINMKTSPIRKPPGGAWRSPVSLEPPESYEQVRWRIDVRRIAKFFKVTPEMLFSDFQTDLAIETNVAALKLDSRDAHYHLEGLRQQLLESPEVSMIRAALPEVTQECLGTLDPRERGVIEMRFGLGGHPTMTLEQVARAENVTRERIRQIESKALRKLRHPDRAKMLKPFLETAA